MPREPPHTAQVLVGCWVDNLAFPCISFQNKSRKLLQRLLFITARLELENELNIHEHAVFVNKEPGQLH